MYLYDPQTPAVAAVLSPQWSWTEICLSAYVLLKARSGSLRKTHQSRLQM